MAEMKGIKVCGDCGNYDWKKHKCKIGCKDDSNAQAPFYGDCPLPDVVPKSEVEALQRMYGEKLEVAEALIATLNKPKNKFVREIFADIEKIINRYCKDYKYSIADVLLDIAEAKKKYIQD